MKYNEGSLGRVFILQLEDGEPLNATMEAFAREHRVERGVAFYVGGGAPGTSLVVGPDATRSDMIVPLFHALDAPHETFAVGTLFPNETGEPVMHMHAACGREGGATVGCTRAGLETWLTGEVVLAEITGNAAVRKRDPASGFELLDLP
jgi:predicted DNA-binding protein with PD1-like motif